MSVRSRSGVLITGLILMALGIIFLLENFYPSFSAWRLIGRYWPVILIIIGVKKLIDYFSWPTTTSPVNRAPKE